MVIMRLLQIATVVVSACGKNARCPLSFNISKPNCDVDMLKALQARGKPRGSHRKIP